MTSKPHGTTRSMRRAGRLALRRLSRFPRSEDGSMLIFGVVILLLMLIVGGMSVDIVRHEEQRALLQATLDRSTLAAASLRQQADAAATRAIVEDYFAKSGGTGALGEVQPDIAINRREVSATASARLGTFFMRLAGVPTLNATARSTALEAAQDIEIVLVLDISGSMTENGGRRLANLVRAASEFVQIVRQNDTENHVSIAIVPFNAQVNLGPDLLAAFDQHYNVTSLHGVAASNCLDLPSTAYAQAMLRTDLALPQAGHFDFSTATTLDNAYRNPPSFSTASLVCRVEPENYVRLPAQDVATLQSQIRNLRGNGQTSITLGMRWGLTLLDPGSRPLFDTLIDRSLIPANLRGRPFDYRRANTQKVIVVMTDGDHQRSRVLDSNYRTGLSVIYRNDADGNYSIYHSSRSGTDKYWVPHRSAWQATPWRGADGLGAVTQMAWDDVWEALPMNWVAWQLYVRPLKVIAGTASARNTQLSTAVDVFLNDGPSVASMNTTLQQSCTQAITAGIIVYGIAFEAPTAGQTAIRNCVTNVEKIAATNYYFVRPDGTGVNIQSVFRSIAAQINSLRLMR